MYLIYGPVSVKIWIFKLYNKEVIQSISKQRNTNLALLFSSFVFLKFLPKAELQIKLFTLHFSTYIQVSFSQHFIERNNKFQYILPQ